MEHNERKVRPTMAQIRQMEERIAQLEEEKTELERKLEAQIDGTSELIADCNGWREKYRSSAKAVEKLKIDILEKEKKLKEGKENIDRIVNNYVSITEKYERLQKRGFWARIFNKEC